MKNVKKSEPVGLCNAAALEREEKFTTLLSIQNYDAHNNRCAALLQRDGYGRTALHYAVEAKHENHVRTIIDCFNIDNTKLQKLLSTLDKDAQSVLHLAAIHGTIRMFRLLSYNRHISLLTHFVRCTTCQSPVQKH